MDSLRVSSVTMRVIVLTILVILLVQCIIANRICVSRKKITENFSKENYKNVIENDSNNNDDAGYQVIFYLF